MKKLYVINHRQLAWAIASVLTGGGLISLQPETIRIAKMDAAFIYILPVFVGFLICLFLYTLANSFPGKNMFEISRHVAGPFFGGLLNFCLVAYIWMMLVRDLSILAQFIKSILLPNTPLEIVMLLFIAMLIQYGRTSIEVIARVNDMVFPVYTLLIFCLPLLLSNEFHLDFIEPFLTRPYPAYLSAAMLPGAWFVDIFAFGAFLTSFNKPKQLLSSAKYGVVLGSVILTIFLTTEVGVLSTSVSGNMLYPNYAVIQTIHLSDFLDRIDVLVLALWFPAMIVKLVVMYIAFLTGLVSYTKTKDYTVLSIPVALFVLVTSMLAFRNSAESFLFGNFATPGLVYGIVVPVLLILYLIVRIKRQQKPSSEEDGKKGNAATSQMKTGVMKKLLAKYTLMQFRWMTRLLLGLCALCVVVGLIYGRYYSSIGMTCGTFYYIALLLALLASYLEMQRTL